MNNIDRTARVCVGDWLVYDTECYVDGDLLYVEVLEVCEQFPPLADVVGEADGGYRVNLRSCRDPETVEDFYAFDFVDEGFYRLTNEEVELAKAEGWPSPRAFLERLRGT